MQQKKQWYADSIHLVHDHASCATYDFVAFGAIHGNSIYTVDPVQH